MHPKISDNDVVWTTTKDRYRSSDAELLKSGLLADAELRCVETKRTWKVHKAILCSRSKWFKKALTGKSWKEGRTGVVEISKIPEYQIDLVLTFIYTGVAQLGKHFPDEYTWIACMQVWKLADFFCLEELKELSTKARDAAALHWAKSYALHLSNKRPTEFPPDFIKAIIYSITALYNDDRDDSRFREAFKSHLLGTAIVGISLLREEREFKELNYDDWILAVDWSLALTACIDGTEARIDIDPNYGAARCHKCGQLEEEGVREIYPNMSLRKRGRGDKGLCGHCFPVPTLEKLQKL